MPGVIPHRNSNSERPSIIDANPNGGNVIIIGWDSHPGIRLRTQVAKKLFEDNGFTVAEIEGTLINKENATKF